MSRMAVARRRQDSGGTDSVRHVFGVQVAGFQVRLCLPLFEKNIPGHNHTIQG